MRSMSQYLNKEEYYKDEIKELQAQISAKDALIDELIDALEMIKKDYATGISAHEVYQIHSSIANEAILKIQEAMRSDA